MLRDDTIMLYTGPASPRTDPGSGLAPASRSPGAATGTQRPEEIETSATLITLGRKLCRLDQKNRAEDSWLGIME